MSGIAISFSDIKPLNFITESIALPPDLSAGTSNWWDFLAGHLCTDIPGSMDTSLLLSKYGFEPSDYKTKITTTVSYNDETTESLNTANIPFKMVSWANGSITAAGTRDWVSQYNNESQLVIDKAPVTPPLDSPIIPKPTFVPFNSKGRVKVDDTVGDVLKIENGNIISAVPKSGDCEELPVVLKLNGGTATLGYGECNKCGSEYCRICPADGDGLANPARIINSDFKHTTLDGTLVSAGSWLYVVKNDDGSYEYSAKVQGKKFWPIGNVASDGTITQYHLGVIMDPEGYECGSEYCRICPVDGTTARANEARIIYNGGERATLRPTLVSAGNVLYIAKNYSGSYEYTTSPGDRFSWTIGYVDTDGNIYQYHLGIITDASSILKLGVVVTGATATTEEGETYAVTGLT